MATNTTPPETRLSLKQIRPVTVVLVLSLIILFISLLLTQRVRPFNSDDTSWQTIFLSWRPFTHQIAYMGSKDNFLVNAPFIFLIDKLLGITRATLFVESLFFSLVNFSLFYLAGVYILKKCNITINYYTLLPFVWLASFGFSFNELFLNPNWRDFELAFSFLFFFLALKLYYHEIDPFKSARTKVVSIIILLIAALFTYSDAYFLYFTLVPIVSIYLVLFLFKKIDKQLVYLTLGSLLFILLLAAAIRSAVARAGLFTPGPLLAIPKITSLKSLPTNLHMSLTALLYIFGATSYIPANKTSYSSLSNGLDLLLISVIPLLLIYLLYRQYKHNKPKLTKIAKIKPGLFIIILLLGTMIATYVSFVLVDQGNINSYRYLIILVFASIILLSLGIGKIKQVRFLIAIIFVGAVGANLANSFAYSQNTAKLDVVAPNTSNYQLINILKDHRLTKGFANYWNSDINTYLSKGSINFLPVACVHGRSLPDYLLVNGAMFHKSVARSFYIIDPSITSPQSCTYNQIVAQFKKPAQVIQYSDKKILIYDYDLSTKMKK